MRELAQLFKNGRIGKKLTVAQVSETLKIDKSLVSKFENGQRRPTRNQVVALCQLFDLDENKAILAWLTEKILSEIEGETLALEALKSAEAQLSESGMPQKIDDQFQKLLLEMEALQSMLGKKTN